MRRDQALNISEFNSATEIVNSEEASFFLAVWACGVEVLGEELSFTAPFNSEPIFRIVITFNADTVEY